MKSTPIVYFLCDGFPWRELGEEYIVVILTYPGMDHWRIQGLGGARVFFYAPMNHCKPLHCKAQRRASLRSSYLSAFHQFSNETLYTSSDLAIYSLRICINSILNWYYNTVATISYRGFKDSFSSIKRILAICDKI